MQIGSFHTNNYFKKPQENKSNNIPAFTGRTVNGALEKLENAGFSRKTIIKSCMKVLQSPDYLDGHLKDTLRFVDPDTPNLPAFTVKQKACSIISQLLNEKEKLDLPSLVEIQKGLNKTKKINIKNLQDSSSIINNPTAPENANRFVKALNQNLFNEMINILMEKAQILYKND